MICMAASKRLSCIWVFAAARRICYEFCVDYLRDLGTGSFIQCKLTSLSFLLQPSLCLPQPCAGIAIAKKLLTLAPVVVGTLVEEGRIEGCGVNALVLVLGP